MELAGQIMIDILLATYNGEKYIKDLLNSLKAQNYQGWRLIVSDDCSTDSTVNIIKDFQQNVLNDVEIHINDNPTGSAKANFFRLFNFAKSPYVMLCDQDDVWLKDKINITLVAMQKMEKMYGSNTPILVNSDLLVVDSDLKIIDPSFFHYSNYKKIFTLQQQIVFNKITGCTVMINKSLLQYLNKKTIDTSKITMHDSWLALIALCFGKLFFINKALVYYRQHETNSVGAPNVRNIRHMLKKLVDKKNNSRSNLGHIIEISHFCKVYSNELACHPHKDLLYKYANLISDSSNEYRKFCIKNGVLKDSIYRAIAQILFAQR